MIDPENWTDHCFIWLRMYIKLKERRRIQKKRNGQRLNVQEMSELLNESDKNRTNYLQKIEILSSVEKWPNLWGQKVSILQSQIWHSETEKVSQEQLMNSKGLRTPETG